jgi:hypothetical protein
MRAQGNAALSNTARARRRRFWRYPLPGEKSSPQAACNADFVGYPSGLAIVKSNGDSQ